MDGGRVAWAGPADGAPARPEGEVLDAAGGLVLPGLVNAHCHAAMVMFRGLADDLPLETWLGRHMFPAEARWVSEETVELASLVAAAEMLLSGTTAVCDAYFCAAGAARAFCRAGLRAVAAQGVIDFPAPGVPDPELGLARAREFVEAWQGRDPLLTPALFAHSPYTCSPDKLAGVSALARELGVGWFTHLAETAGEARQVAGRYGRSPARHLAALGVLANLTAGVHGVWLEPAELELLAAAGVALVHCPESNAKLASGLARVEDWRAAGLAVGLGTDGAASNNDLDMLGEMGAAARLAKLATGEPAALPAEAALAMATAGSAAAAGLEGAGRLEPGAAADAVVLEARQPHLTPLFNPASAAVYAARGGDVRHTVVAGRVVVRHRRLTTFDLAAALAELKDLGRRIARRPA
jgi:5-methylthioadenosine/S-adenosylhomocysteine deaminase